MNLSDPFKQLMERRLWPVAVLLVAALVAVPMLLKEKDSSGGVVSTPIAAVGPTGQSPTDDAVVAAADASRTDEVRSVLGDRKDPFRPAQIERIKDETADATAGAEAAAAAAAEEPTPGSTGGSTTEPTTTPVDPDPTVTVPEEPRPTYELYSLVVRFGTAGEDLSRKVLERLTGLPGGNPAIMYLGLLEDHKTAAFMVDAGVAQEGDGKCHPSPDDCQTLTLKKGETHFFTRGDRTYQLDLENVITKKTFNRSEAVAARKAVAKGGLRALRRNRSRAGAFRYSAKTGTLSAVRKVKSVKSNGGGSFVGGTLESSG